MSKRVLVCEDDGAIRQLLGKVLSRHHLAVDSVASGSEAAARLLIEPYDLIVLDLLTPGLTGYEVVDLIRRERPHLLDRVVVVTALQRPFWELLPVAAIVRKPFDLEEFDRLIDRVLFPSSRRSRFDEGAGAIP